jgi:hypothetical protein
LALQIEARRPGPVGRDLWSPGRRGTVPGEMIDGLANMVDPADPHLQRSGPAGVGELSSRCVGVLRGESAEHVDEVEKLLKEREDDLKKLIAISEGV